MIRKEFEVSDEVKEKLKRVVGVNGDVKMFIDCEDVINVVRVNVFPFMLSFVKFRRLELNEKFVECVIKLIRNDVEKYLLKTKLGFVKFKDFSKNSDVYIDSVGCVYVDEIKVGAIYKELSSMEDVMFYLKYSEIIENKIRMLFL